MHKINLTLLLLCFACMHPAYAQTEPVNIEGGRYTIGEIILTVEGQTRFSFAYDSSIINVDLKIQMPKAVGTLGNLLNIMDSQSPYAYTFYNRYILINPDGGIVRSAQKQDKPSVIQETDEKETSPDETSTEEYPAEEIEVPVLPADTVKVVVVSKEEDPYSEYISPLSSYFPSQRKYPLVAIKSNLLYAAAAFTPNLGAEIQIGNKSTIELTGGYNWYRREGTDTDNKKLVHWFLRPEYRYWFCQPYNGHYIGGHAFYGRYNIAAHNFPWLFGKNSKQHRFEGDGYGVGISYGYSLVLGRQWNAEFTAGLGYARLNYEKFACDKCSQDIGKFHKNYFGPTRLGISIVFLIK